MTKNNSIKLTCVRHGESIHNRDRRIMGWIGSELTELGEQQAKELADKITEAPQAIFYSDLNRCKQTAEVIMAKFPDVPAFADWRLRERSFGNAEGKFRNEIDFEEFFLIDPDTSIFNGEPENHLRERVKSFMRDLESFEISNALIVAHSGVLNRFNFILKDDHTHERVSNGESIVIEYSFDDPRIQPGKNPKWSINDIKK